MPQHPNMKNCFMCNREFQMGPDFYAGTYIPRYKFTVCNICWEGNWTGGPPCTKTDFLRI
jgi:hypothetical protein